MAELCIYLPPFASDYTGVCSSLFDLNCLIAINDGSCCTAHYVFSDEPRWEEKVRPVFSTQLRTLDAVLGNDKKVIDSVVQASDSMDISMIALVGTPVPAITGMDMEGIACEIEDRSGICSLGFSTSGFEYYDRGIAAAGKALISRFSQNTTEIIPRSVNILGMTPLDYGDVGNDTAFIRELENAGWHVNACLFMGAATDQIKNLAKARINLAVSASGLEIAKLLKTKFGTPFLAAAPVGQKAFANILQDLDLMCEENRDVYGNLGENMQSDPEISNPERILIVMDQIMGNSLRRVLYQQNVPGRIDVASFFGWDSSYVQEGDCHLKSEKDLVKLLRSGRYRTVVGDPMLSDIPDMKGIRHFPLVHPAISGKLYWKETTEYLHTSNIICF